MKESDVKAIITAAGEHEELRSLSGDKPTALLDLNDKSLLQRQVDTFKKAGVSDITVIRGFGKEQFNVKDVKYYDNDNFKNNFDLESLFCAEEELNENFIFTYSDIIFENSIIKSLKESNQDIVVVIDRAYQYHKHKIDKELDLVITKERDKKHYRRIQSTFENRILRIGKKVDKNLATAEFIGIVYFSENGAENLKNVYHDLKKTNKGKFHEASHLEKASITDMLQEMIDRGFKVGFMEINQGWIEIHNKNDYLTAKDLLLDKND